MKSPGMVFLNGEPRLSGGGFLGGPWRFGGFSKITFSTVFVETHMARNLPEYQLGSHGRPGCAGCQEPQHRRPRDSAGNHLETSWLWEHRVSLVVPADWTSLSFSCLSGHHKPSLRDNPGQPLSATSLRLQRIPHLSRRQLLLHRQPHHRSWLPGWVQKSDGIHHREHTTWQYRRL